jgi:8-oxo-dGTP diphosphatase
MKQFPTHIVAVDGIVENERNEILLVKNRDKEVWTVPGGQVEIGENLIDALIREIKESSFAWRV